jgi:5-oxoprolinase (ATP-hydrolysing)
MADPSVRPTRGFRFAIDRGGTFTDVYAFCPGEATPRRVKLLSVDPSNYPDAPREGIRRILEAATGVAHPRGVPLESSRIAWIRMGTTVATNALLERDGAKTALLVTKGFRDALYIGTQARPDIFDLRVRCPGVLYDEVVEVDERVLLSKGDASAEDAPRAGVPRVAGVTGETLLVEKPPDLGVVREDLVALRRDKGVEAVAIVFMHAYTYDAHEKAVAQVAREVGFRQVTKRGSGLG